ncbi:DUF3137 domain-containing protein [Aureispira anguillae]|nr:DUF3137 domain-containing protein [Aureispira anguillae]
MHSKLVVFEQKRKRLILLMAIGVLLLMLATIFVLTLDMFALSIFLFVPWFLLFRLYRYQANIFTSGFKPIVVQSILEYMDSSLTYYYKDYISKDTFLRSGIFPKVSGLLYYGEDYIMGKIGEIFFEMSELEIHHTDKIKAKLEQKFKGVFFHANFNTSFKGRILMIPRPDWQLFIPVMKEYTKYGGYELTNTGNAHFDDEFLVYLDRDVHYKEILTPELITAINQYHLKSGKKVYASFYNSHFYMAIDDHQNLLEASVFHSNLNFELIAAYYQELTLFTEIVKDFDITH